MTTVFSARDLGSEGRLTRQPVAEVMTIPARFMRHTATDAVAVIDQLGRPVGLLTEADLVGLLAKEP